MESVPDAVLEPPAEVEPEAGAGAPVDPAEPDPAAGSRPVGASMTPAVPGLLAKTLLPGDVAVPAPEDASSVDDPSPIAFDPGGVEPEFEPEFEPGPANEFADVAVRLAVAKAISRPPLGSRLSAGAGSPVSSAISVLEASCAHAPVGPWVSFALV